jgi:hypothetical protein
MNKIYDTDKNDKPKSKKKYKSRIINKRKTMKYLLRIRDKSSKYFCDKLNFLEIHKGDDILGFMDEEIIILFIKGNNIKSNKIKNNIINYVINNKSKEFVNTEMELEKFKRLILNEDFSKFDKVLSFSRNLLYKYEIDLMNDVNDWLNGEIADKKYYKLLFTN